MVGQASDMTGKAVLVTGAASEMGRAAALVFARLGADVCVVDEPGAPLEAVAEAARQAGARAASYVGDVARAEDCRAAVAAAVGAFGRLDALVNLANAFTPTPAAQVSPQDFERTLAVNVAAPFYLFQAAIPHLLEADGAVVYVSSAAAVLATPNTVAYSASKAALNHMARVLAKEYAQQPVRINVIAGGAIAVNLAPKEGAPVDPKAIQRGLLSRGTISPEEVAEMIAFLCSDAGRPFHGAVIAMDKGMQLG
jgi:NAD(P)-dependent dehydrogenase (short-subunit alcohol dehydrogenase family)